MKKNAPNAYNTPRTRSAGSRAPVVNAGAGTRSAANRSNAVRSSASTGRTTSSNSRTRSASSTKSGVKTNSSSGKGKGAAIAICAVVAIAAVVGGWWYFGKGGVNATENDKKVDVIMADGTTAQKTVGELKAELTADVFFDGITIDGMSVAGRTKDEVIAAVRESAAANAPKPEVKFRLDGIEYPLNLDSLPFNDDVEEVVSEAFNFGRPAPEASSEEIITCYSQYQALKNAPKAYTTSRSLSTDGLAEMVRSLLEPFNKDAVDAEIGDFNFETLQFDASESSEGCIVNIDKAIADAKALLDGGTYEGVIDVESEVIEPKLKSEDVTQGYGLLSTATSETTWNNNRNNNINQACQYISEKVKVLKPGDSFSFNETVGQRTADRGFLTAGTYQNGKVVDDYGGGICQVSTMIYQAALKADLEIVERHNHMFTGSYFDPGLDATVDWGNLDFKFSNNTEYPIALSIGFDSENRRITVNLYGKLPEDGGHVELASEVISTNAPSSGTTYIADPSRHVGDNSAPEGDYHVGKTAKAYKVRFDANGNEVSRELIVDPDGSEVSVYRSSVATVMVGVLRDDGSIAEMDPNTGAVIDAGPPPEETQPSDETAPSDVTGESAVPTDTQPTETQATETTPSETQPTETQQPVETTPTETQQPTETQAPEPTEPTVLAIDDPGSGGGPIAQP